MLASFLQTAEAEEMHVDNRSVDDLLSFINGGDEGKLNFFHLTIQFWGMAKRVLQLYW